MFSYLPKEIITNIIIYGARYDFALSKTCKLYLNFLLEKEILIPCANINSNDDFLFTSLPLSIVEGIPYDLKSAFCKITSYFNPKLINCCVAGGFCVKKIYNLNYKSDIDIWIQDLVINSIYDEKNRVDVGDCESVKSFLCDNPQLKLNYDSLDLDLIVKTHEPYRCISNFDLSLCQCGINYDVNGNSMIHITPMFLYTFYSKKIIIRIAPLNRNYGLEDQKYTKTLEWYFWRHCFSHHSSSVGSLDIDPFDKCKIERCQEISADPEIKRWFDRISKYRERFPNFKFKFMPRESLGISSPFK